MSLQALTLTTILFIVYATFASKRVNAVTWLEKN